jgi:hypothetical protein
MSNCGHNQRVLIKNYTVTKVVFSPPDKISKFLYVSASKKPKVIYSLLPEGFLSPTSASAFSLKNLRRILPDGFFGIASMNETPPANRLCFDTLVESQSAMAFSVAFEVGERTM